MSKQVRLEALKLAVASGAGSGAVLRAATFEKYLNEGIEVASEPEIEEDAKETPTTGRRRRRTKDK